MVVFLLSLADGPAAVAQAPPLPPPPPPQELAVPQDPMCYDYYLKMHDIEFGTLEYVTKRNKMLEARCGAFHRAESGK